MPLRSEVLVHTTVRTEVHRYYRSAATTSGRRPRLDGVFSRIEEGRLIVLVWGSSIKHVSSANSPTIETFLYIVWEAPSPLLNHTLTASSAFLPPSQHSSRLLLTTISHRRSGSAVLSRDGQFCREIHCQKGPRRDVQEPLRQRCRALPPGRRWTFTEPDLLGSIL